MDISLKESTCQNLSDDEIRLVILHPAPINNDLSPIECDLKIVKLPEASDYEALSYVWGTETASKRIYVAGQAVPVSLTLYNALLRLRSSHQARTLWCDQLCISQDNLDEKAQQVQLMRTIYKNCAQCVVWMGEIKKDVSIVAASAGLQFLQYCAEIKEEENEHKVMVPSTVRDNLDDAMEALRGLGIGGNAWWSRAWTVQESALPKKLTMQWGPLTLDWQVLADASDTWPRYSSANEMLSAEQVKIWGDIMVHTIWLEYARNDWDELHEMIHRWRFRQASDARDKIYGLLGMCEAGRLPRTELCNYSASTARVFSTLTLELIVDEKGLQALTPYPRPGTVPTTPGLPSWVSDLAATGQSNVPDLWYQLHGYSWYAADDGMEPIDVDAVRSQFDLDSLSLVGVHVDTIVRIEQGYKKTHGWDQNYAAAETLLPSWYEAVMDGYQDDSPQDSDDGSGSEGELGIGDGTVSSNQSAHGNESITVENPVPEGESASRIRPTAEDGSTIGGKSVPEDRLASQEGSVILEEPTSGKNSGWEDLSDTSNSSSSSESGPLYPGDWYTRFGAFARLILGGVIRDGDFNIDRDCEDADLDAVWELMDGNGDEVDENTRTTAYGMIANQNMFITKLGLIGLGHVDVQVGDEVWVFRGGKMPFTIRRRGQGQDGYTFLGHCYVEGIMTGEVAERDIPGVEFVEETACLW